MTEQISSNGGKMEGSDLSEIRVRRDSPAVGTRDAFLELKNRLCAQILAMTEPALALRHR